MVQLQIYHKKLNAPTNSALKHTRCVQEQYLKDYIYLFILEISFKKTLMVQLIDLNKSGTIHL